MNIMRCIAFTLLSLVFTSAGAAQVLDPPFFDESGIGLFDPTIEVVNSGALLDAQAVVSHDRRYVTITTGAANTSLLALETFAFQEVRRLGSAGGTNPGVLNRNGVTPLSRP